MKVICKGHNTCEEKLDCEHSKPHKFKRHCELYEVNYDKCQCSHIYLRKEKLEKLFKLNETR